MQSNTPVDITGQTESANLVKTETRQGPMVEGLKAATEAPVKEDEALSAKFAALARREKSIRQQMKAKEESFRQREDALKAKETEYQTRYIPKDKFAQNPFEALQEAGVTEEQIAQYLAGRPTGTDAELLNLKKELQALKAEQEQAKSQVKTDAEQRYDQAKKQIKTEVSMLVDSDDSFEVIKARGDLAKDAVVELIEEVYKAEGYLMSVSDAAAEVENHLQEETLNDIKRFSDLKKIKEKLNPPAPVVEAPQKQQAQKPGPTVTQNMERQQVSTLSNRAEQLATKPMTNKERRERAIAAFHGTLNNS